MTQELSRLAIAASDNLARLLDLQELLRLALEQLDQYPTEKEWLRVDLLVGIYLSQVEAYFDDLEMNLSRIRQQSATGMSGLPDLPDSTTD